AWSLVPGMEMDCGLTPAPALGKIVGGSGAGRTEWPWQASLRLRHRDHRCGAVLVAERWLLSAAHWLLSKQLQKAAVRVIGEQACRRFYPVQISSRMACAGLPHGTVDSCSVSPTDLPSDAWCGEQGCWG
uniref:Peptidase S1 domain-containing protein n=1 Tax=Varanus komodoensis TaxID=61221 RepID=A0A8D2LL83_VARKO